MSGYRLLWTGLFLGLACTVYGYDWNTNPGEGIEANPYQISEPNHLIAINDLDTTGVYFVLMNDIDLDPNLPGNQVIDSAIVAYEEPFEGFLDGQGYAIQNMQIIDETEDFSFLGLFGKIGPEGIVKNLTIADYDIRVQVGGNFGFAGSLAGQNLGVIVNCFSNGSAGPIVEGDWFDCMIGGLVGINGDYDFYSLSYYDHHGLIANSGSHSTLTILYGGAGLVSYNFGSIYQCYSHGYISDKDRSSMDCNGGLVSRNHGVVNRCFSDSVVETDSNSGLCGFNSGIVRNSYALGVMKETYYGDSAGLVAANYDYEEDKFAKIENCYAACQLEDGENVQGLAGGGYDFYGTALSSFWDIEVSGTTESYGGKGLTTAEMKNPNTFINAGWDFVGETVNGAEDFWQIDPNINNGYPSLIMKPIDGGEGSPENPYIIYTKQHLLDFFNDSTMWDKHIKLIANIDLSDTVFTSAPVGTFNGVFDGSGCTIDGLTVDAASTGVLGLFDVIDRNGYVKNLYINDASMADGDGGILATLNLGQIIDCHVEGTVEGGDNLGGLVAVNDGDIYRCSADCVVTGFLYAGGLVSENSMFGSIRESYVNGAIGGNNYNGGLAARNYGKIKDSYSNCSVSGIIAGALAGFNDLGLIVCCYATGSPDTLVGSPGGVVAHSYYGNVQDLQAWEGNSWYEEDGHIWTVDPDYPDYSHPSLKWQRWGTPVTLENLYHGVPFYRQDPTRDGSEEHPYLFSFELADYPADWDKHFVMTEDVDMVMAGASVFDEAVIPYFNGTLDGGGHVIRNLFMENNQDLQSMGFFGMLGHDAQVKQLGIEGEVNYQARYPGLLVGTNFGILEECYAKGSVTCPTYGGILTGFNGGTIRSCYAEGDLTLQTDVQYEEIVGGGLYAGSWGRVMNSYSSVEAIYLGDFIYSGVGGLNEGLVWNSYWNVDLTDPNFMLGGKPLTTAQMQDADSFVGWGDNIWKIAEDFDLPRLSWENTDWVWTPENPIPPDCWPDECPEYIPIVDASRTYGGGDGTAESPYVLTDAEHLFTLGKHLSDCDKYFMLSNDIDLSGQTLSESVIGYFAGNFNGKGHSINGLSIDGIEHLVPYHGKFFSGLGLFGCVDTGGVVENLAVENVNIDGMCTVGGLAGENNGTIRRSFVTGCVRAEGNVGGLVGSNGFRRTFGTAQIEDCYTNTSVIGDALQGFAMKYLGGIAGANNGLVVRCHAAGSIDTDNPIPAYTPFIIGGIAGWSSGGDVEACYYSSAAGENPVGTQIDPAQMKQRASFVGWDFVGESTNGENEIWRMCVDGVDHPQLSWEFSGGGDYACPAGVNLVDFSALAANWLTDVQTRPDTFNTACDGNLDDQIGLDDLLILADNWLTMN